MLQEHKAISRTLEKLSATAKLEGKPEHALFAEKLMMHARNEEEVLYPCRKILVGEYLEDETEIVRRRSCVTERGIPRCPGDERVHGHHNTVRFHTTYERQQR